MVHHAQHEVVSSPGMTYFDLDGDKQIKPSNSEDSGPIAFTWRGDPNETMSDYTIVVVTNELQTSTYHVHKSALCFGPRHSKYFAQIMLNSSTDKWKKKSRSVVPSTKVELDQRDANNFPIFLDWIYAPCANLSSNGTVVTAASTMSSPSLVTVGTDDSSSNAVFDELTTENSVSLRFLAKRFDVDSMMLVVNRFIQKDLNFKTGPTYLSSAAEYNDSRLMDAAQRLCAENIEQISSKSLMRLPPHLFRIVIKSLESFEEDNNELSIYLSEIVCRYLEKYPESLSASLLLELTDPLLMPCIASEAAIGYTALIKELKSDDVQTHWKGLVSLSRRCAKAVVQEYGWSDFSVGAAVDQYLGTKENGADAAKNVDSLLFATSFAAALDQAQDDHEEILIEQDRLEKMVNQLFETVTSLEKSNSRKDEHLAKQQWAIEEAKKQIVSMKKQIGDTKRNNAVQRSNPSPNYPVNDEVSMTSPLTELVSPSQVGLNVHEKKNRKMQELRTKTEMRARSIIF